MRYTVKYNWIERRYRTLWYAFNNSEFRFEDAVRILKENLKDEERQVNVFLSEMRKEGRLEVRFYPEDARKRIYKLKSSDGIIAEKLSISKNQLTRGDLESLLKGASDLSGQELTMHSFSSFFFYKRISDKWELEFETAYTEALQDGLKEEEAKEEAKNSIYHDFAISEELLWENIRKDPAKATLELFKGHEDSGREKSRVERCL